MAPSPTRAVADLLYAPIYPPILSAGRFCNSKPSAITKKRAAAFHVGGYYRNRVAINGRSYNRDQLPLH